MIILKLRNKKTLEISIGFMAVNNNTVDNICYDIIYSFIPFVINEEQTKYEMIDQHKHMVINLSGALFISHDDIKDGYTIIAERSVELNDKPKGILYRVLQQEIHSN